ncbi:hypothetical protein EIN_289500 [Entamoeba invadens IP1]|uniref:Sulfotransferase n=1 Tax=Entamoeba invadens IP1 TaxID=370355 RepID=L7FLE2_ENTIV|nr:hypothetical protein EIN_289500 [Entamoeba invadens IP1]ELP86678.1 hypothetical protein EIN_289500 [Entamoeba invadens IP1]|eukprot:XP_004186024.1 hypothetical protein EIN_289500 [Entamoeba invadens IP1]
MSEPFVYTNVEQYQLDTSNKYLLPELPESAFGPIYLKVQEYAVQLMCQLDPTHAEEYKTLPQKYHTQLEANPFKQAAREFFAGCFDPNSQMFKNVFKYCVGQVSVYLRFLYEQEIDKENLSKVEIKNPLFIVSMPRSGSTFAHHVMSSDPLATSIKMYEHFCPGSKTMSSEGRLNFGKRVIEPMLNDDINKRHKMDVEQYEEEICFKAMLGFSWVYSLCLPRLEQYREHLWNGNFKFVYDGLLEEFKMHLLDKRECPWYDTDVSKMEEKKKNFHLCLKAVSHFVEPMNFFNLVNATEGRILWIHREIIPELKSLIPGCIAIRGNFVGDIGMDDVKWTNECTIKIIWLCLKNGIAARDKWVSEDPQREKQIYDISFTALTKDPIGETKKIYKYFNMEYSEEFEENIKKLLKQKEQKDRKEDKEKDKKLFMFDEEEVKKQFMFYYERFEKYLPDYFK